MRRNSYDRRDKRIITSAHILQSLLACAYIFAAFWVVHVFESGLAIASLGASAFIAFSFPHAKSSRPKFLLGGYAVGAVCGIICAALYGLIPEAFPLPGYIPACALAVLMSMLIMTVLNFEHPPAAALAVALTTASRPIAMGLAALLCVAALVLLKEFLKNRMRNL